MRLGRSINSQLCFLVFLASACLSPALAATYEVGPGKPLTSIGAVPWATLQAGDTVLIHWRSTPYKEKWVIARQGTAAQPITVSGVPGPAGQLPVSDSGSGDSDGTIVSYEWDFDDGGATSGVVVNHTYTATGVYNATLTVTDDDGASSTATVQVQVDPDILAAPVLSGSASGRVASLSWTHSGDADGFYVERGRKR